MSENKIIKKIKKYDYISFDIFDTLVKRNVEKPSDIFKLIEENNGLTNFCNFRMKAENIARNRKKSEITLNDIYNEMSHYYSGISMEKLMNIEIETEIKLCVFNNDFQEIYKYCKNSSKHIIIISDMYLPRNTIDSILKTNNITYEKLYLSCEIGRTKAKGDIFDFVINDLNINPHQLIHIGDNLKSDFINPKLKKISSIKIPKYQNHVKHYHSLSSIDEKKLFTFVNNNYDCQKSYFYNSGFAIMGPLLYSFCNWLNNKIEDNSIDKILFFSRDGLIIKKAYELIYGESKNNVYFRASRRAIIVPSLIYCNDIKEMIDSMYLEKKIKLKKVLINLGLNITSKVKFKAKSSNIDLDSFITIEDLANKNNRYYKFLNEFYDEIKQNSLKENQAFLKYFESICNGSSRVAIVDIGWFGNMQNSIEKILKKENLNFELYGFYIGLNPYNVYQTKYKMYGFLFDYFNSYGFEYQRRYNSIFETMFTSKEKSLKKYILTNNIVNYEFKSSDNNDKENIIEEYQDGALKFVEIYMQICELLNINWNNVKIIDMVNDFGVNPTLKDAEKWGDLIFESGSSRHYIAKPRQNKEYIFHISKLINDLKDSYWKIGFLKRVFKIKFNYNLIYKFQRRK